MPPSAYFSSPFSARGSAAFSRSSRRRCKMGKPRARVLPDPVSEAPTTSYRINTYG